MVLPTVKSGPPLPPLPTCTVDSTVSLVAVTKDLRTEAPQHGDNMVHRRALSPPAYWPFGIAKRRGVRANNGSELHLKLYA